MRADESFAACEALIMNHAPLLMRIAASPERPERRIAGRFQPHINAATIARMKKRRAAGETIGDIAREYHVSWKTASKHSSRD